MSKYSRIRHANTKISKSVDFSDLSFPPQMHKAISNCNYNSHETKQIPNNTIDENTIAHDPNQEHEHEGDVGETFGVILSRKYSISSSTSSRKFMAEKQNPSVQSMVKKTFSMKRSVSVSEGYCRIHFQCDPSGDDENAALSAMHARPSKKKGKIFKTCRRLFGF